MQECLIVNKKNNNSEGIKYRREIVKKTIADSNSLFGQPLTIRLIGSFIVIGILYYKKAIHYPVKVPSDETQAFGLVVAKVGRVPLEMLEREILFCPWSRTATAYLTKAQP